MKPTADLAREAGLSMGNAGSRTELAVERFRALARADALEEAALRCEESRCGVANDSFDITLNFAAAAIRALAVPKE